MVAERNILDEPTKVPTAQAKGGKGGFWRRLAAGLLGAAVGGGIGGLIALVVLEYGEDQGWWRPTPAQARIDEWTDSLFSPYAKRLIEELDRMRALTDANVNRFNLILEELNAYRSYYEFKALRATGEDQEVYTGISQAIGEFIVLVQESWLQYFPKSSHDFDFVHRTFNAVKYSQVGSEFFNWQGVQNVKANKYVFSEPGAANLDSIIRTANPGTTTGGGSTTPGTPNNGGLTPTAPITPNPSTGGGSSGSSASTGGGKTPVTTPEIPDNGSITPPIATKDPEKEPEEKGNKKIIVMAAAAVAAYLILK